MDKTLITGLLDKYFDGQSTLDEERCLRRYFRRRRIPPELKPYQPLFRYFSDERHEGVAASRALKVILWTVVSAAACLLLFFALNLDERLQKPAMQPQSLVYINGALHTDVATITAEGLNSLEILADGSDEATDEQVEAISIMVND
jgi:hypothetical protein